MVPAAGEAMGIGSHTDYECLTLLYSTAPGLEVLNSAGVWVDAPPLPGALVVNIGDMMEIWTNGEFVATSHRVRPVKQERFSFPLFFAVDYDTEVKPLDLRASLLVRADGEICRLRPRIGWVACRAAHLI